MNSKIKIIALFGSRVLFGQERANLETLAALRERGCEVLCIIRDDEWPEILALRKHFDDRGIAWIPAPYIDYPLKGWMLRIIRRNPGAFVRSNRLLATCIRQFNPTHIHAFNPMYVANFYWALRRTKVPLIYRSGDRPTRHNPFYSFIWRFIRRRANHFVADSKFIKKELIKTGIEPECISVIYAPPPSRNACVPVALPPKAMSEVCFRFVFVGQISPHKGIHLLIGAFRTATLNHPHAHLLIAGPISDWEGHAWGRQLRDETSSDPIIGKRVHFLSQVEDVPRLMEISNVHVAPTVALEPYGLVVVEAKLAGIPSIIFASGGMVELVHDGLDGTIVHDKNEEELANAMEKYLIDPDLARMQGKEARKSLQALEVPKFAERWHGVYQAHR